MTTLRAILARHVVLASRSFMWHGTSDRHLRSILKQGLIPNPKEVVYDESWDDRTDHRSMQTYGGVYLTRSVPTAMQAAFSAIKKRRGPDKERRLIIGVSMETRTPGTMIDEDYLMSDIQMAVGVNFEEMFGIRGFEGALFRLRDYRTGLDLRRLQEIADIVLHYNFREAPAQLAGQLLRRWPKLQNRIHNDNRFSKLAENVFRAYACHLIEGKLRDVKRKNPDVLDLQQVPRCFRGTFDRLRNAVDTLSLYLREAAYDGSTTDVMDLHNIRIHQPITYRGRNQIVFIAVLYDDVLTPGENDAQGVWQKPTYDYRYDVKYNKSPEALAAFDKGWRKLTFGG